MLSKTEELVNLDEGEILEKLREFMKIDNCSETQFSPHYNKGWSVPEANFGACADCSIDHLVGLFGLGLRNNIIFSDVKDALVEALEAKKYPKNGDTIYEFSWFLFSQKKWHSIIDFLNFTDVLCLPVNLRKDLSHLYFLSFYKVKQRDIKAGMPSEKFAVEVSETLIKIEQNLSPGIDTIAFFKALISSIIGNFSDAREEIGKLRETVVPKFAFRAANTLLTETEISRAFAREPVTPNFYPVNAGSKVFLISLDKIFFDIYFDLYVERLKQIDPQIPLHIHCVNFDPRQELLDRNLFGVIGYTSDFGNTSAFTPKTQKTYYASARFLFLEEYLNFYDAVYVVDIDGVIGVPISILDDTKSEFDVAVVNPPIKSREQLFSLPWDLVVAGNVVIQSTEGGRIFGRYLRRYLSIIFSRKRHDYEFTWFADQNALFSAWLDLENEIAIRELTTPAFSQTGDYRLSHGNKSKLNQMTK
ncbi:MAG: hypothetical protein JKY86_00070 [Gammaproteobacteria bacterium]|nr:hypothetical protein [Gammaproteobacteria bacterium]